MSESCTNIERYFGNEEIDENSVKVSFGIPAETKPSDINLKIGENSYLIEYEKEEKTKEDGWVYHSSKTGHYMKSYPFKIVDAKASFNNGMLILSFQKGDPIEPDHKSLEINIDE